MGGSFEFPAVLWGLLLIPVLAALYAAGQGRRFRHAVGFPDVAVAAAAAALARPARRHVATALFLGGLAVLIVAAARPRAVVLVPSDRSAIMLAMDVSGSMRSEDVKPSRMIASQNAAKRFLATVPPRVRVGLVSFAGFATLLVPPVTDRARVIQAIDGFTFARRTAVGEGILEAVAALPGRARPSPDGTLPPLPAGDRPPGVVILITDGRSNSGIDPLVAAAIARQQDVKVYTVGVGLPYNAGTSWTIGGPLDDEQLRAIAKETDAAYFHASSAQQLREAYERLARTVGWERRMDEVTSAAGMFGGLIVLVAVIVSRLLTHPLG